MSNFFKDFMQPAKIIFDRLEHQRNKRIIINGNDGVHSGADVDPPYYADLPEYPCRLIRDSNGKVTEIQYGESSRGFIWRQLLVRRADGKLDYIEQENPDGSYNIVLKRNASTDKVEVIDID